MRCIIAELGVMLAASTELKCPGGVSNTSANKTSRLKPASSSFRSTCLSPLCVGAMSELPSPANKRAKIGSGRHFKFSVDRGGTFTDM